MVLCFGGCGRKAEPADVRVETESVAESEEETVKLSEHLEGLADVYIEVGSTKVDYLDGLKYDKKVITGIEVDDSKVNTKQAGVYTLRYILSGRRTNGEIPKETVKSKVFVVKKDDAQKLADAGVAVETDEGTKKNSKGEEVTRVASTQNASNSVSGGGNSYSSNTNTNMGSGSGSNTSKPSGGNTSVANNNSNPNNNSSKPSGGNSGSTGSGSGSGNSGSGNNSSKPSGGSNNSGSGNSNSNTRPSTPSTPSKPAETKPSTPNKPAETQPSKPAETKPSAPSTPAETRPAETKPQETEPPQTNPPETDPPQTEPKGEWVHHKDPIYSSKETSICNGCGQDITGFETDHGFAGAVAGTSCANGYWVKFEQEITGYNEWDEWVEY